MQSIVYIYFPDFKCYLALNPIYGPNIAVWWHFTFCLPRIDILLWFLWLWCFFFISLLSILCNNSNSFYIKKNKWTNKGMNECWMALIWVMKLLVLYSSCGRNKVQKFKPAMQTVFLSFKRALACQVRVNIYSWLWKNVLRVKKIILIELYP